MSGHAFEDFPVGRRFESRTFRVTEQSIIQFGREFDPQLFHIDREMAKETLFRGLAASGWHTAAVSMRLFVNTMNVGRGIIGLGVDELRWPNAVRPGDRLRLEIEIVDARLSRSRRDYGIIRVRNVTKNQRNEIVQSFIATAMLPKRAATA